MMWEKYPNQVVIAIRRYVSLGVLIFIRENAISTQCGGFSKYPVKQNWAPYDELS